MDEFGANAAGALAGSTIINLTNTEQLFQEKNIMDRKRG
jgi:hypothetical protein